MFDSQQCPMKCVTFFLTFFDVTIEFDATAFIEHCAELRLEI